MPFTYIHWKEECDYCDNRNNCEYEKTMREFKTALSFLKNGVKGIYGSLNFTCDYFKLNENKFNRYNIGVTDGTNS